LQTHAENEIAKPKQFKKVADRSQKSAFRSVGNQSFGGS
jgi:hypothetical protein